METYEESSVINNQHEDPAEQHNQPSADPSTDCHETAGMTDVKSENAAPHCKDAAPDCKDAAPDCKDAGPDCKDAAPDCKDAAPGDEDAAPDCKDAAPDCKDAAPSDEDAAPDCKDAAPGDKDAAPDCKDAAPGGERAASGDEDAAPDCKDAAPGDGDAAPDCKVAAQGGEDDASGGKKATLCCTDFTQNCKAAAQDCDYKQWSQTQVIQSEELAKLPDSTTNNRNKKSNEEVIQRISSVQFSLTLMSKNKNSKSSLPSEISQREDSLPPEDAQHQQESTKDVDGVLLHTDRGKQNNRDFASRDEQFSVKNILIISK